MMNKPQLAILLLLPVAFPTLSDSAASADNLASLELVRQSSNLVEVRMPYAASTSVRSGDRLELSTSDGNNFGLQISSAVLSSQGNRIIRGSTDGQGTALLVVTPEGAVLGSVEELGQKFRVNTDEDGSTKVHILYPSNNLRTIDEQPSAPSPTKPDLMGLDIDAASLKTRPLTMLNAEPSVGVRYPVYKTGTAEISVLIYYDQSLNNWPSIIDYVMDYSNQAFIQSGIDIRLVLAGAKPISLGSDFSRPLSNKMWESQPPFENIAEDRRLYEADIVVTIKSGFDSNDEYCGYAPYIGVYKGRPFRNSYVAVASWQPDTYYDYCDEATFTHEVGHLLGGMHLKADFSAPIVGAYSYSHAHQVVGAFSTLMVPYSTGINRIQQFSSPNASCSGYSCGVVGQSDMVDTFNSTGHIISGFEGSGFSYELVNAQRVDEQDFECEKDGLSGYWEAHGTNNQSKYGLELASVHFVRTNGTSFVAEYNRGDRIISPNRLAWRGWCVTAENPSGLRTEYVESFARFYNPLTDEIVQSESLFWDTGYSGEYRSIRVATGQGGSVSGNTAQSVRIGSSKTFSFTPSSGYEVANIQSNCSGSKSGNSYTVDVGQDNCFVEASFNRNAFATAFIERFYTNILGRPSDSAGLNGWLNVINTQSAAAVAQGFLSSAEFLNKNLDDSAFIDILYRTLFDREGDAGGVSVWMDQLGAGRLREMVIWDFLRSAEFRNLADSFGVTALNSVDASAYGIRAFVERFYSLVLGRQPDKGGFDNWVTSLANGSYAGGDIAKAFFLSAEYLSQNTSNDAFVSTCYRAFFGREADAGGKQGWLDALAQGQSRAYVLDGFIGSAEFATLASSYGIEASRAASESARVAPESVRMARDPEVELRDSEQAKPIPSLPIFVLFMLGGLMGLFGLRRLRAG